MGKKIKTDNVQLAYIYTSADAVNMPQIHSRFQVNSQWNSEKGIFVDFKCVWRKTVLTVFTLIGLVCVMCCLKYFEKKTD